LRQAHALCEPHTIISTMQISMVLNAEMLATLADLIKPSCGLQVGLS